MTTGGGSVLDHIEPLVVSDPGDDNLRRRYLDAAESLGRHLHAAEALEQALENVTEPSVLERVGFDVAMLYLGEGELPRARSAFLRVVRANAGGPAGISAARRLLDLQVDQADPETVGPALDLLASVIDPSPLAAEVRHEVAPPADAQPAVSQASDVYPEIVPPSEKPPVIAAPEPVAAHVRHETTLRRAQALGRDGRGAEALQLCRELFVEPDLDPTIVERIAEIAHDEDDAALYRHSLEFLAQVGPPDTRTRAMERLGDFQFEHLKDRQAAAASWRPAARVYDGTPGETDHARHLYERVLEALPDDRDAAERLTGLYTQSSDWRKLPEVIRVLVRTDPEHGARSILDLERAAIEAAEVDEFVSLVDDVFERLPVASPTRSQLERARARVLGTDPAHQAEASLAYRKIIESSGSEDDVRAFEAFVESRSSAEERHRERRWLYEWRVTHGPRPENVLFDWARAEEELGDAEAALAVYERLRNEVPARRDALEAICRLKLQASDFEGGLAALRALRDGGTKAEQRSLTLRMARLLLDDLGQPAEAALALMPLLDVVPPVREAHDMMSRTLSDAATSAQVAQRLEQLADGETGALARRVFLFLVQAREGTAKLTEARRRWFRRLVELSLPDRDAALAAAIQGVTELPDSMQLWDLAERLGRELDRRDTVVETYHHALVESAPDPALADALGHRMVAFADEYGADPSRLVQTLQGILVLSPGNLWALDRVKLALGAQARWDELFGLYDRAIDATGGPERAELLHEAACAAKDLAGLPERAIPYLEEIHRSRPDDVSAATSLERLYERQGRTRSLVALLEERLEKSAGFKRFETLGRIASFLLELGDVEPAFRVVERMFGEGAAVADVTGLLERISDGGTAGDRVGTSDDRDAVASTRRSAIALLRKHYEEGGQADDVVRMALKQLELADRPELRARCVRDLVDVRLAAAKGTPEPFDRATKDIEADVAGQPALALTAFQALLKRALRAWQQAPGDADAMSGAWRAIGSLKVLLWEAKRPRSTVGLLYRCSRLPFERHHKRQLLRESAVECAKGLGDQERAVRIFAELFAQEGGDEVAAQSVGDYAALLDATGRHETLATMWEQQSRLHANAGNQSAQRACWERAAALWERQGALAKAIGAYQQAAALSSESAFEALAKIYENRGDWELAAGALEWLYAQAPAQKRGLRVLRLAEAYTALDDRARAKERLERAIQAGVETERAAQVSEFLVALYRRDSDWRPLAVRLAADADRTTDPEKKLALLREASELIRDKLDAPAEAAALLEKALALAPRDGSIRLALADQLEALEQWNRLVEVLRDPLAFDADASNIKQRAFSHHRLARALALAGRHDDSLAELRLAADLFPTHATILHHLARAALEGGALDLAESTNRALLLSLHHTRENLGPGSPRRADVFLDLSEIAVRKGDMRRAADLVDSAVEAGLDANEDFRPIDATLAARGRYDLLARAVERRLERATTLAQRACALGDLVAVWSAHLDRSPEVRARIAHHAESVRRELEREESAEAATWTAAAGVFASIGDEETRATINRRRVTLLKAAVGAAKVGTDRSRLRVHLAKALLEESGEAEGAISALSAAIDEDPNHAEAADVLSEVLERRGRHDERVVLFERRAAALRPDSPAFLDASWQLGRALESAGRRDDALRAYESLSDRVPCDGAVIGPLVDRLESFGSGKAGDALERWIAGGHRVSDVVRRLIEHRERRGTPDQLRRALELGLSIDPGDVALALRTADFHRSAGNPREAIRALGSALLARPGDSKLLSLRADLREAAGDPDGALSDLEVASASDAVCLDALVALHGRLDNQSVAPIAAAHTVHLVDLLIGANRAADARREVDRLLTRNPNYAGALERLASLSAAAKEWDLAIDAYRKLFALAEKGDVEHVARIVSAMAETCERAERPGDAREIIERALTLLPDDADLLKCLGRVYELSGDWTLLVKLWTSRAEKEDRPAARAQLLVRAGSAVLENGGERSDALRLAEMARAADPENIEVTLLWAQVKLAEGCASEALAVLRDASERNRGKRSPFGARISLETAKAHLALDELLEALDHLKAAFVTESRNTAIAMLLGLVAVDLDDERTAERALLAVTGTAPRTADDRRAHACAFFHLALLARAKNDGARARRLAGKALALQPDHAEASILVEQLGNAAGAALAAQPAAPRAAVSPRS